MIAIRLKFVVIVFVVVTAGCTTLIVSQLDQRYGKPTAREYSEVDTQLSVEFNRDVLPVLERRCTVCHGCYDAPCQLKLESYQGLLRGASEQPVYATRILEASPTRLFEDAQTSQEWRNKGFFPVINERGNTPTANIETSVMARILALKQKHPLPADTILDPGFDLSLARNQQCPRIETFDSYAKNYPQWGMPYALPGLAQSEYQTLQEWLKNGAQKAPEPEIDPLTRSTIERWESFLNGDSNKQRLMSRYIYEHLFLAHLYFENTGSKAVYFQLVRSNTPPGEPLDRISTRRPFDHHGSKRVYYRLWRYPGSIMAKSHMPYPLYQSRLAKWQSWFIDKEYEVTELPGYDPALASNPFITFQDLPVESRYNFLLDEAQFSVMNFIKGPVCRGSAALNVIRDRFWVLFVDPTLFSSKAYSRFLAQQKNHLRLPVETNSNLISMVRWLSYSKAQQEYISAKTDLVINEFGYIDQSKYDVIWNGDRTNANAALTVFRHIDSASVVKGLVGEAPLTVWLIDYPILERIHYLLVAGFDVFGNISHQATTRLYADFLRMESEMNFLAFLPKEARQQVLEVMYRDAMDPIKFYLEAYAELDNTNSNAIPSNGDPRKELFQLVRKHLSPILNDRYSLSRSSLPLNSQEALSSLSQLKGKGVSLLPQVSIMNIDGHGIVTLIRNNAYTNIASIFHEKDRHLPDEDTISVINGVIGAYPNAFLSMTAEQIPIFVKVVSELKTESDYTALVDQFGIRRTDPRFWEISDEVYEKYRLADPVQAGILDFNRLENR